MFARRNKLLTSSIKNQVLIVPKVKRRCRCAAQNPVASQSYFRNLWLVIRIKKKTNNKEYINIIGIVSQYYSHNITRDHL